MKSAAVVLALALGSGTARAADKRVLPEFDGRPPAHGEGVLVVPRIALFPVRVAFDYLIRAPIRAVVLVFDRDAEEGRGPRDRWDVRPVLSLDLGFRARIGALVRGNVANGAWSLRADTGGASTFSLGASVVATVDGGTFTAYSDLTRRPDTIFHGFGPASAPDARIRVPLDRGETGARFTASLRPAFAVATSIGVRGAKFGVNVEEDYVAFVQRVALTLDGRPLRPVGAANPAELHRASGVRVELDGEHAGAPAPARRWIAWGGSVLGTLEIDRGRVLELAVTARFVDPLGTGPPPYLEQVSLGGSRPLRGHLEGRLYDRSALAVGVTYRWPVWLFFDGFVSLEAGNVFAAHLRDVNPRSFRLSATTGLRNSGASGYVFELLGGFGTEPIEGGASVSSGRFLLAATRAL